MAKVIGIGETVFDITFGADNQPVSGRPGGSVYNALISLGRVGVECKFISEVGNDRIGLIIKQFLEENGVDSSCVCSFDEGKSPLALAFLDENKNAQFTYYKDFPAQRLSFTTPQISSDDIVLIGSYFALNPTIRQQVSDFLAYARSRGALIYYDVNFRATHCKEVDELMPAIVENFDYADIVKGSDEDFCNIYGHSADAQDVFKRFISKHCSVFLQTRGSRGAELIFNGEHLHTDSQTITPVSTIGAGDSFNAGVIYELIRQGVTRENLNRSQLALQQAVKRGIDFASQVCQSYDNYIAKP